MIAIFYGSVIDKKYEQIIKLSINSICQFLNDDVVIIDTKKGKKLVNFLGEHQYEKFTLDGKENWVDVYEDAKQIIEKRKIDKVIFFRNVIIGTFKRGNSNLVKAFEENYKSGKCDYNFNFMIGKNILHKYVFMKVCSDMNIDVYQFFTDVQELSYGDVLTFPRFKKLYLANVKDDHFIFMPTFEYGLSTLEVKNEKQNDFCFYCTALTDDRKYILDYKEQLESNNNYDCKIVPPSRKNQNEIVSQVEYDHKLSMSKFTLAIPAYDNDRFSIWRIFEALQFDCLCLILSTCNLKDIEITYPDLYKVCTKYLIVDTIDNIKDKIKELDPIRESIIEEIKNLETYKKITNFEWCQNRWKRMLEVQDA